MGQKKRRGRAWAGLAGEGCVEGGTPTGAGQVLSRLVRSSLMDARLCVAMSPTLIMGAAWALNHVSAAGLAEQVPQCPDTPLP